VIKSCWRRRAWRSGGFCRLIPPCRSRCLCALVRHGALGRPSCRRNRRSTVWVEFYRERIKMARAGGQSGLSTSTCRAARAHSCSPRTGDRTRTRVRVIDAKSGMTAPAGARGDAVLGVSEGDPCLRGVGRHQATMAKLALRRFRPPPPPPPPWRPAARWGELYAQPDPP